MTKFGQIIETNKQQGLINELKVIKKKGKKSF